ncbi:MAG: hypothetical protein ABI869_02635, partial [Actinomycetota bacterium]
MNTDIKYLELLEHDLRQAAAREQLLESAPPVRHRSGVNWGTFAAAAVPILVVAGLIGWLATSGGNANNGALSLARIADVSRDPFGNQASTVPDTQQTVPSAGSGSGATGATGAGGGFLSNDSGSSQAGDVSKIIRDGTVSIQVAK